MLSKKFLLILIPLGFIGFWLLSTSPTSTKVNNTTTKGEIKAGMVLGSKHVISSENTKVTVGKAEASGPIEPYVTVSKWDEEVSLGINYPVDPGAQVVTEDNKITWKTPKQEVYFKNATAESGVPKFEFDILLKEKPEQNTFTYKLETAKLEFKYNEKDFSYSAYKKGYLDEKGIYNKGEVFRIERPKIIDAKGQETWGKLDVILGIRQLAETPESNLTVTVDPAWLASASYPVTVDPTIALNDTNHVLITKVDRFRWKLAVEYEIRDDTGKILGSDVVIMEANQGETKDQIFGFLKSYLTQRSAVWLLAQGQYTLYEMSMDRVSAAHFKASDSGDDVDDEHKTAREARKQILNTLPSEALAKEGPTTLTLIEAGKLQHPDGTTTTFPVQNEKPGAGTEILRPDGAGYATQWASQWPTSGSHWQKVDEASYDSSDFVYVSGWTTSDFYDGYSLQATALTSETITSITATMGYSTVLATDGEYGESMYVRCGIRKGTTNYLSAYQSGSSSAYTSAALGSGHVVGDLNAMQVVIHASGEDPETVGTDAYVFHLYVTVNYTAATPTPTPIRNINGGANFFGGSKF